MSVGGKVTEVIIQENAVYIDTYDKHSNCAIFVERDDKSVKVMNGDIVWWQGDYAYWTTSDRKSVVEQKLKRRGFSGVSRPLVKG